MAKNIGVFALILLAVLIVVLVVYGIFVLTSVNRFASFWAAQNEKPQNGNITIVALGDSTVQGVGATSPYKGFVGQLARKVGQGKPVQVYNYSKSGATARDVVQNQLSYKEQFTQADVIVVAVGPNDATRGVSNDDYLQNYRKILDALPAKKVVIATIPPLERSSVSDATVQEWNAALTELAAEKKVRVAEVYQAIKPRSRDPRIYSIDLFHPSNIGYGLWAGAFYQPVSEVLNSK